MPQCLSLFPSSSNIVALSWGYSMDPEDVIENVREDFLPDFQLWIAAMIGVSLLFLAIKALVGNL